MAQRRPYRRPQPCARARDAARGRPDGRRLQSPAHRGRQHLDRDRPLQLSPPRSRGGRQARDPRGRRHAARVQHRLHLGRHHDGLGRHAGLAGEPRGHGGLDRARRPRQPVRRAHRSRRLRQDHPRRRHGACAPRHSRARPLRRLDRSRTLQEPRRHHSGRVRGRRRARCGDDVGGRLRRSRTSCVPRRRRLRRSVHREHHGHGVRDARHFPFRQRERAGRRRR